MFNKSFKKSHKMGKLQMSLIAIMVVVMAVSAIAISKLNAKVGISEATAISYSTSDKAVSDALEMEYSKVSELIPTARQDIKDKNLLRNQSSDELFASSKYDDKFFDELQSMVDQNVDPNIIMDYLFSIFNDAEKQFISDAINNTFGTIGQVSDSNTRGTVSLGAYFSIGSAALAGAAAAAVVKVLVGGALSTLVTWIISTFTAFLSLAGPVGSIIGFIAGSATASLVYNWVKDKINEYLAPLGNNQFSTKTFTFNFFYVSGWLVFFNLSHDFDLTYVITSKLIAYLL